MNALLKLPAAVHAAAAVSDVPSRGGSLAWERCHPRRIDVGHSIHAAHDLDRKTKVRVQRAVQRHSDSRGLHFVAVAAGAVEGGGFAEFSDDVPRAYVAAVGFVLSCLVYEAQQHAVVEAAVEHLVTSLAKSRLHMGLDTAHCFQSDFYLPARCLLVFQLDAHTFVAVAVAVAVAVHEGAVVHSAIVLEGQAA